MSNIWRLINSGGNHGFYNMAIDEAISIACRNGVVSPTLRFYTWSPPTISIGYFQEHESLSDNYSFIPDNTPVVRRITGGRAILHGNDLSYSIVCPTANRLFPDNLKGAYSIVTKALISGLAYLDITPDPILTLQKTSGNKHWRIKADPSTKTAPYHHSKLCFDTVLGHEITVNGKKLMGSAQRRWTELFLQHGSILIDGRQNHNGPASISLNELLRTPLDIKEIISALCAGFQDIMGITLIEGHLTGYEVELAENLVEDKYSKISWNKR
ncbi:MAG: hypothetical protein A2Y48_05735 [Nitrospirae bacterium RIFCSPLOW2_12_42_9]|nr:MAG: hypothetical protein A2Y48_05735 [Nitrospirae bacterium RIFCSPLOW2_12_42_9]